MEQIELAKIIGVAKGTISKWKAKGIIVLDKKNLVDEQETLKNLQQYNKQDKADLLKKHLKIADDFVSSLKNKQSPKDNKLTLDVSLQEAERLKEIYNAQIRKLQVEQMQGNLVSKEAVTKHFENMAMVVKQNLLALPSALAPELFKCESEGEIHKILHDNIWECLNALSSRV